MNRYNQAVDGLNLARVNLAVTELPFPKNYYTWNTADRKGIVIGIHSLRFLFEEKQAVVNDIILLVAKRMLIYSLNIPDLRTHEATRGCIFDNTVYINHIQYAAANPGLCSVCRQIILEQKGPDLLETLTNWVERKNS
jgi:hypothetical protein